MKADNKTACAMLVRDIRIPYREATESAIEKAKKQLLRAFYKKTPTVVGADIAKISLDARKKPDICFVVTVRVDVLCRPEDAAEAAARDRHISVLQEEPFVLPRPSPDARTMDGRPVIVGFGPGGMFCALLLCAVGMRPVILERGDDVEARVESVARFYQTRTLDPDSNIQFGAGGAGTFSDGKLMTRISDPLCTYVLSQFVRFGADPDILIKAKPHVGTDVLLGVVAAIRDYLRSLGCEIHFRTTVTDVLTRDISGKKTAYAVKTNRGEIRCGAVVLALGHSAHDTYRTLFDAGMAMEAKPFSVGARIEHLQSSINEAAYGKAAIHTAACGATGSDILLPPAEYAVSYRPKPSEKDPDPRGVYSFCMCPGGEVMASSSEKGGIVVNGMSRRARDGVNANAALLVSVRTSDIGNHPMEAIAYQRTIEATAFFAGGGDYSAPCQTVGDFLSGTCSTEPSRVLPSYMNGGVCMTDLHSVLPPYVTALLATGIRRFDGILSGFSAPDALLTGVETRTSAPVRLLRGEDYRAFGCENIYPVGEGAGYAGGITSAAVDGIRCACKIAEAYRSVKEQ